MSKKNLSLGLESEVTVANEVSNEVATEVANEVVYSAEKPEYDNIDWLRNVTPFFPEELTSAKCKLDREPKVQDGLTRIAEMDKEFPELFKLLGLWWENKEARKNIKNMIDDEAVKKGYDPVNYMQNVLRGFAMKYDGLADAVDRLKYATTYFKPRGGVKDTYKLVLIDGVQYNVNLRVLAELKEKYIGEKDNTKLKEELKKVSEKIEIEEL